MFCFRGKVRRLLIVRMLDLSFAWILKMFSSNVVTWFCWQRREFQSGPSHRIRQWAPFQLFGHKIEMLALYSDIASIFEASSKIQQKFLGMQKAMYRWLSKKSSNALQAQALNFFCSSLYLSFLGCLSFSNQSLFEENVFVYQKYTGVKSLWA